jgi:RNA polymerase sigma-70 factor, ECF subfamily
MENQQLEALPGDMGSMLARQRRQAAVTASSGEVHGGKQSLAAGEAALVRMIGDGDGRAFDEIFGRYSRKVFQIAYRLLNDRDEAEDAVQEVFLTVFQKAKTFRGQSQFSTWLYRLAVNAALSRMRRQKRRKEIPYDEFLPRFQKDGHHQTRPVMDWSQEIPASSGQPELRRTLKNALDALRPVDKAVLVLSDVEEFSDQEIGQAVGLSTSAVKTRLHRARLFLRGKLAVSLGYSAA